MRHEARKAREAREAREAQEYTRHGACTAREHVGYVI